MPGNTYIFNGEIIENAETIASGQLSLFVSKDHLCLRPKMDGMFRGKEISLSSFNPDMFLNSIIKDGVAIFNEGLDLGSYRHGPLGHPGDGEFEIYKIIKTSIFGKYEEDGLDIQIEAQTGRGKDVCFFAKEESDEIHPPLVLLTKFHVPKTEFERFLGMDKEMNARF
jgi:hypothetical protein